MALVVLYHMQYIIGLNGCLPIDNLLITIHKLPSIHLPISQFIIRRSYISYPLNYDWYCLSPLCELPAEDNG